MAGLTDDSDVVSRVNREVKTLENPLLKAGWVAEPNIPELNFTLESFLVDLRGLLAGVSDRVILKFLLIIAFC